MIECPACGARSTRPLYTVRGFQVVICTGCGLARTELPADFDPTSIYTASYFDGTQDDGYADYQGSQVTLRAEFARAVEALCRQGVAGGALLEVGCAYGYFLDEASQRFAVSGVEVSDEARAACRARGLVVERALTPELIEERGPFDAAVMLDVIEHLREPGELLAQIRGALRMHGRLMLTTGDFGSLSARLMGRRWRLMTPPQHLWFFSPATLGALLARSGFRVLGVDHPWKVVPLSMITFQGIRVAGLSAPRWIRRLPGGLPVNLFDAMRVVAEAV